MHLLLDPGDDRPRFPEISLRVPWRMRQRHEHLPAMAAMLTNVVLHDRVPTGESVLVTKTLEDALRGVPLLPIYEQDFVDCSYGFRPGRGAHQALQALWEGLMEFGGGWVIDLDIEDFFGSVDWGHLRSFLDRRVRDGVIRRAIGKWLNAGVMEAGKLSYPERGTPQGGVVSPTLSNVYLHEVLDQWFEHEVKPRLRGRAF